MAKKYIDVMDTTFRDGFQSVFGGRVLMDAHTLNLVVEQDFNRFISICKKTHLK